MRALCFEHVHFEGLGSIGHWLRAQGARIDAFRWHENGSAVPAPVEDIDLLVVMGGPMSANDEAQYPWLAAEKRYIRGAIDAGKAVLGICLGAQLIASALGARVYPNAHKEIGWFPVEGVKTGSQQPVFAFAARTAMFHWHGETFDLPPGAVRLARSAACANQAFQLGRRVIGLQFHLETTPDSARALVENCRDELVPAAYVQTETEILGAGDARYAEINRLMESVLEFLTRV